METPRKESLPIAVKGNVYEIARAFQIQKMTTGEVEISPEDASAIHDSLKKTREGTSTLGLLQGYEVARWLMIHKALWPGKAEVTEHDRSQMNQAAREFKEAGNIYQLASLIHTAEFLGEKMDYGELSEKEKEELKAHLAEIK